MNHHPQYSGIAKALAAHGRNGDTELLHVSKSELAALNAAGAPAGIHLTKNPETGLYEAFNWMGALGGVVGGIIGTIIEPGGGTAAGAAIGSGLGTAAGGGTTQQILTSAVVSGIAGYAGSGIAGGLADVGTQATTQSLSEAGGQTLGQAGGQALGQTGTQSLAEGSSQGVGQVVGDTFVQNGSQALTQTPLQQVSQTGGQTLAEGSSKAAGTMVGDKFVQYPGSMTFGDKLAAGWGKVTESPSAFGDFVSSNAKPLTTMGIGALGVGMMNPGSSQIVTPQTGSPTSTANPYKAEVYYTPDGQKRTRVVKAARGGSIYGDYDGVDEAQPDDGYMAGGTTYMAAGGATPSAGGIEAISVGTKPGNVVRETDRVLPEGFFTKEEYARATPEEKAEMRALEEAKKEMTPSPTRKQYPGGFAGGGGIGDLGGYSDGGRLLKGPGDGVSDSIPASIENKQPARLADGEFVVPARAVSELGNGSTEAGSKQLYKMLDRIAAKRKSGKGLAYESNPKKLLPA